MDVKVETKCGRCGKKHEQSVSLEKAQGMVEEEKRKAEALASVENLTNSLDPNLSPQLIVLFRDSGSSAYAVMTLDNLCANTDAKRNKGCSARVVALVNEIFAAPKEKKPRAPRKAKETKPTENGATKPAKK